MDNRLKGHLGFKGEKGDTGDVGTPKVYSGLATELLGDDEVDKSFHYIVLNESDSHYGHWFYYDVDEEAWRDGGLYQAQGIAEGSITFDMLSEELQEVLRGLMGGVK